jgi:hypothetical protein
MRCGETRDRGLEALLSLNDVVLVLEEGYWVKFEARVVEANEHVPQGIRYSLTLHDRNQRRLIGYDNAHSAKVRKRRYSPRSVTWDHRHVLNEVFVYRFESPEKLLSDFWNDVYQLLK